MLARSSLALLLVILAAACNRRAPPSADAGTRPLRDRPKTQRELPTTDATIYLQNLDGQIAELRRLVAARPDITANVQQLGGVLHLRGRYRGDLDEIQQGIEQLDACVKREPENATCFLLRAEQEQSLHRFKEARADVDRARTLGADASRVADLVADLDWSDGRYEAAIAAIRAARLARPSASTWLREAQLDHDLGLEDEAEAAFEAAEDRITDTAPLPVAHLYVQRGMVKIQRGTLDKACEFFREAVARMPTYVAANEHLAETLHMMGKDDEAIAIYEKVVKLSDDPEFAHALAELYATHGKAAEARELDARARTRYAELLAKYPEAMYWHASEFYASIGDKKRALELLRKNVVLRPNSASHVALAKAELEAGSAQEARVSIDKALAMPVRSATLWWTAADVYAGAGDEAKAATFRARAKRANPRVEQDER